MTEQDILDLIQNDEWMMNVLQVARDLDLPDWMIGAGFVRNKVWDYLHGYKNKTPTNSDIDLVYFDLANKSKEIEEQYDRKLKKILDADWQTKNQARMGNYESTEDAVAHWPETVTAIGVKIEDEKLKLIAPYNINDLINLTIKMSPKFTGGVERIKERMEKKEWLKKWPKLKVKI